VAEQFGSEVVLGVEQPFPAERAAQGWPQPVHRPVTVVDMRHHDALAAHRGPDMLHVFSGFFSNPLVWAGFRRLARSRARLAIYSEAPEQPPLTGWLKRLRGRFLVARWARRVAFVLAVGVVGCEFYARAGFPAEKIVPLRYFPDPAPLPESAPRNPADTTVRFLSAGQFIHRKGIDLLIAACAKLPRHGWRLDIYGDGPERAAHEQVTAARGLADRIVFHGMASNDVVRRALVAADCAVLPSRFDGWQMLVDEALAAGTPVICTDRCGAAAFPEMCGLVATGPAPRAAALARELATALKAGGSPPEIRHRLAAAVRERSSAAAGAEQFLAAALPAATAAKLLTCQSRLLAYRTLLK
jgi:glycosyltransferase involved in cell wall biosynthesis